MQGAPPPGSRPSLPPACVGDFNRSPYLHPHYDANAYAYPAYSQAPTARPSTVPVTVDVPIEQFQPYFQGQPYPLASPPRSVGPYYNPYR